MKIPRRRPSAPPGIALMLVMLVIFALTVIIAAFAYSMRVEMRLAQITNYDDRLEWMGRSGVELARYALAIKCPGQEGIDALNQYWAGGTTPCSNDVPPVPLKNFQLGDGTISVTIVDMERKWDINTVAGPRAPQLDVLQKAMMEAGVTDPSQSSMIIDSLMDWLSPTADAHANGAKNDYYTRLDPPYYCKNGPMDDLSELLLIKGVTPEIYWGSNSTNHSPAAYQNQPDASRHSGPIRTRFSSADDVPNPVGLSELFSPMGSRLNINTASIKTLQLLPGIDAATAERIVQQRAGPDGVDGTDDDIPFHNVGELNSGLPGGGLPSGPSGAALPPGAPPGVAGAPQLGVAAGGLAAYCDVKSYVFEVHVDAEVNGYKRSFTGIVSRQPGNSAQLQCVRFHWD